MAQNLEVDEKKAGVVVEEENVSLSSSDEPKRDLDAAAKFLQDHKDIDSSNIDINKVRHKIDRNVITCLCLVFIMTFLDKAIYNVSLHESSTEFCLYKLVCWHYGRQEGPQIKRL
jgi:hypothetical protein